MRLVTGSVLAVLVGGVAYMNFFANEGEDAASTDATAAGAADSSTPRDGGEGAEGGASESRPAPVLDGGAKDPVSDEEPPADRGTERDEADAEPSAGEVLEDLVGEQDTGPQGASAPARVDVRVAVRGDDGASLAAVDVYVVTQGTEIELGRATTDDSGVAELGDLEPGLYQLRLDAESIPEEFAAPWQPALCRGGTFPAGMGSPCFAVLGDGRASEQTFEVVHPAQLVGRVFGRDGEPAADAIARVVAVGTGLETCRAAAATDTDGRFRFELVPAKYRLEVSYGPDGPNAGTQRFAPIEIELEGGGLNEISDFVPEGVAVASDGADEAGADGEGGGLEIRLAGGDGDSSPSATGPTETGEGSAEESPGDGSTVELSGRALSTFGEPLADLEVVALQGASVVGRASTDADGNWRMTDVPSEPCVVRVRGVRLLGPSDAVEVAPREGQRRIRVRDVLVEVRRTFRVAGSIDVATETLDAYRTELRERTGGALDLEGAALEKAYLRTLRLEQRNLGASSGRVIAIAPDGSFEWSCALPAEDVEFVLQARGARAQSRGQVTRVRITPAGDRTLDVKLAFPPSAVQDEAHAARDEDAHGLETVQSLPANL